MSAQHYSQMGFKKNFKNLVIDYMCIKKMHHLAQAPYGVSRSYLSLLASVDASVN